MNDDDPVRPHMNNDFDGPDLFEHENRYNEMEDQVAPQGFDDSSSVTETYEDLCRRKIVLFSFQFRKKK